MTPQTGRLSIFTHLNKRNTRRCHCRIFSFSRSTNCVTMICWGPHKNSILSPSACQSWWAAKIKFPKHQCLFSHSCTSSTQNHKCGKLALSWFVTISLQNGYFCVLVYCMGHHMHVLHSYTKNGVFRLEFSVLLGKSYGRNTHNCSESVFCCFQALLSTLCDVVGFKQHSRIFWRVRNS